MISAIFSKEPLMDKKNGFTIIEIMVVIVIMGILAAVGVPKLFGMIAKAKAAEVPTAAGVYVRLQDAFVHNDHGIGSWKDIGYAAPGDGKTNNFEYGDCVVAKKEIDKDAESFLGWSATNLSALNECSARSAWGIVIDPVAESTVNFTQVVSSQECASLTSNWPVGSVDASACSAGATQTAEPEPQQTTEPEPKETTTQTDDKETDDTEKEKKDKKDKKEKEDSSSQDIDCQALEEHKKTNNEDNHIYIPECGFYVPNGHAPKQYKKNNK
ncbi:prepilin-type N-terminal cleavage/methylation domain-containing protein [Fibrobacter sp. UWT3]|uniref:prepilin-type N-terminal cleavage/methylation domain-containing protein n=1 Tax=Fibrobacter sp. UWT3 TaxID=1896225 RepID=UPI0026E558CB|nr:prepilin-type N-terminal cleavage/methylation domain-containing protein [Fibrobacter sp. UWT3]